MAHFLCHRGDIPRNIEFKTTVTKRRLTVKKKQDLNILDRFSHIKLAIKVKDVRK